MHRTIYRFIGVALALSIAAVLVAPSSDAAGRRWGAGYFANNVLLDQDGRELRFYDDVVKNRIVVINFIYTSCTDICPLSTARMAQVADMLGDRVGRDVFLVSLTVDPANDTPKKLKAYAEAYGARPGWLFLTGTTANVRAVNAKLGEKMLNLNEHRNEVVLGNDRTGEWARNSLFGDLKRLAFDIHAMDPAWRAQVRKSVRDHTSDTGYRMSAKPGEAMFKRMCAGCHAFKVGDRVGPDLYGVTARRDQDWLVRFLKDPAALRKARDPIASAMVERFPEVRMPSLGLNDVDARDLISYLDYRTKHLDSEQAAAEQQLSAVHAGHQHSADHGDSSHHGSDKGAQKTSPAATHDGHAQQQQHQHQHHGHR